jgi:hypothetical protein
MTRNKISCRKKRHVLASSLHVAPFQGQSTGSPLPARSPLSIKHSSCGAHGLPLVALRRAFCGNAGRTVRTMAWRSALSKNLQELRWVGDGLQQLDGRELSSAFTGRSLCNPSLSPIAGYTCARPPRAARAPGARNCPNPACCHSATLPAALARVLPPSQRPAHSAAPRRDFVLSGYQELKKANPTFPILVRECGGVEAKLVARYGAPASQPCCPPGC